MRTLWIAALLALAAPASGQIAWEPDPALAALAPLVGAPWQSTFETERGPSTDVSRFEWAMNGKALRNVHAVDGGTYGGETLIWASGDSLRFIYVTSGGFVTEGTAHVRDDGALVAEEVVTGHEDGIDRVRSVAHVDAEGRLHTEASFRTDGVWSVGRVAVYERAPDATLPPTFAPACTDG